MQDLLHAWRTQLDTRFPQVDGVFESCMAEASRVPAPVTARKPQLWL